MNVLYVLMAAVALMVGLGRPFVHSADDLVAAAVLAAILAVMAAASFALVYWPAPSRRPRWGWHTAFAVGLVLVVAWLAARDYQRNATPVDGQDYGTAPGYRTDLKFRLGR